MGGRCDAHGDAQGIVAREVFVHLEEVTVALAERVGAETLHSIGEVEIDATRTRADASPVVAHRLDRARSHVAWHQVAVTRIPALEEIVPLGLRDVLGAAVVACAEWHPDAPVVAQRLGHERELRLMCARGGQARGVELHEAGIGERRAAAVRPPDGRRVRGLGVGRQEVDVRVPAGRQYHRVRDVRLERARDQVARDHATRPAVDHQQIEHLAPGQHGDAAGRLFLG